MYRKNRKNNSRPTRRFPACTLTTLVALGLAAPAAQAQGVDLVLQNGDALLVDGTGTSGLYRGQPVMPPMSGYTSYTDDNVSPSYVDIAVQTTGTATFTLGTGGSVTDSNGTGIEADGSGLISITGGSVTESTNGGSYALYVPGSSPVSMTAGLLDGGTGYGLYSDGGGAITLSGGTVQTEGQEAGVYADGPAALTLSGASVSGGDYGVRYDGSGPVTLSAGSVTGLGSNSTGLEVDSGSLLTLSGGMVGANTDNSTAVDANITTALSGAAIRATGYGARGLEVFDADASVSSGSITVGDGGTGLEFFSNKTLTVTGGTITAGADSIALDADAGTSGTGQNRPGAVARVSGGAITAGTGGTGLRAAGADTVFVTGGTIAGGDNDASGPAAGVDAEGSAQVTISGGAITGGASGYRQDLAHEGFGVLAGGGSRVTFSGGTVTAGGPNGYGLFATGGAVLTMTGGTVVQRDGDNSNGVGAGDGGTVLITGGHLGNGDYRGLYTQAGGGSFYPPGTIDLFGTNFEYTDALGDFVPITSGQLPQGGGEIIGTLLDGESLDTQYGNEGVLEVNVGPAPAPEPSQAAALGIGLLGLAGLTLKARRRAA